MVRDKVPREPWWTSRWSVHSFWPFFEVKNPFLHQTLWVITVLCNQRALNNTVTKREVSKLATVCWDLRMSKCPHHYILKFCYRSTLEARIHIPSLAPISICHKDWVIKRMARKLRVVIFKGFCLFDTISCIPGLLLIWYVPRWLWTPALPACSSWRLGV